MSYKKVLITGSDGSYCTSYKRALIANTNPIQLLNPKIFRNVTHNGITSVAKDGIITLNGTAIEILYLAVQIPGLYVTAGHKMLITGCPAGGTVSTYYLYDTDDYRNGRDFGDGKIYTIDKDRSTYIYIYIGKGQTVTNLQFKPQFYDLTAMFGAGNEPTTVAEFREKFPNDIYPQNLSYCSSPQSALITPTINLFDESKIINKTQHDGYWTSSADIYGTTGHFYKMTVEPNTTYTVLCGGYVPNTGSDALFYSVQVGNSFYDYTKRLTVLVIGNSNKGWLWRRGAFIVPDGVTEVTFSCFPWAQFRDFMVVKGSVPVTTTYVPYNYI